MAVPRNRGGEQVAVAREGAADDMDGGRRERGAVDIADPEAGGEHDPADHQVGGERHGGD